MMVGTSNKSRPVSTSLGWQITTCNYLHTVFDLSGVPGFALGGIDTRPQNSGANSLIAQDSLKPGRNIVFLRVHREDLTPITKRTLRFSLESNSIPYSVPIPYG
jgi:hypothetical protein